jgi:sulfur-carrier protein adenylyltransferase/sulfurtransferase
MPDPTDEEDLRELRVPDISPAELSSMMNVQPDLVILDVREPFEVSRVRLDDPRVLYAPVSALAEKGMDALPEAARSPQAPIVVFCHLGFRSAQVVWWLQQIGWTQVYNLAGGIDAYAQSVDTTLGRY